MRNCAEVVLNGTVLDSRGRVATHRVSFDVSGEEGVMYAGAPARRTKEYEQMDAHTLLSIS